MKLQPYVQKLNNSSEYKQFINKYPDSFLIAGFFILDFESGQNLHQIDYYVPKEKKVAAFSLDQQVRMQLLETVASNKAPEKLDFKTKVDLDALNGILEDEMKNRSISEEIKKIIAILQMSNGKKLWNLNCVLSGMEILRAHIEDETKSVLKMEKISMMDIMKRIPKQALAQMQGGMAGKNLAGDGEDSEKAEGVEMKEPLNEETAKKQIDKLNLIEQEIEKQKDRLKKVSTKKEENEEVKFESKLAEEKPKKSKKAAK